MRYNYEFGIFDFDGTIWDSKKLHRWIIKVVALFSKYSSFLRRHNVLYVVSSCSPFSYFLKSQGRLTRGLDTLIFELFNLTDKGRQEVFPGVREVLKNLSSNGMKLFGTTLSKTKETEKRLKEAGLLRFFTRILGGDIPKSEHIPYFIREMGLKTKQSFYLGDSVHDMCLAELYDIDGFGITNTVGGKPLFKAGAKQIITSWQELERLL